MEQLTVKDLFVICRQEILKGNGDKVIVVSDDNEGNGYHGLFYAFSPATADFADKIYDSREKDLDKLIILG